LLLQWLLSHLLLQAARRQLENQASQIPEFFLLIPEYQGLVFLQLASFLFLAHLHMTVAFLWLLSRFPFFECIFTFISNKNSFCCIYYF